MIPRSIACVLVPFALLLACASEPVPATCEPEVVTPAQPEDPLLAAYLHGLAIAQYPTPERASDQLLVLEPGNAQLTWDAAGRLLVTTWTRAEYFGDPKYQPGHAFDLYGQTWFSTGTQVHDVCSKSGLQGDALVLRLEQLLGMPPGRGYDVFMQVWIDPQQLFRPCAEPSVLEPTCPVAAPLHSEMDQVTWDCSAPSDGHSQWLCNNWVQSYGSLDPFGRFPWTALGYTYDWSPENPTGEGPSEFVAPARTPVVFERLVPTEEFCKPAA
ncbi:MAG TPA: hypothetical protein VM869_29095 [Enhygromyxa sp.]|nr:hypothetical protein [Enhygromyxa sp.]